MAGSRPYNPQLRILDLDSRTSLVLELGPRTFPNFLLYVVYRFLWFEASQPPPISGFRSKFVWF